MAWYEPIAYVQDAALRCPQCATETSAPVFEGSETDCPNHCECCEEYLPEALTADGVAYVLERLSDARNGRGGRVEVLDQWADAIQSYGLGRAERVELYRYLGWRGRSTR